MEGVKSKNPLRAVVERRLAALGRNPFEAARTGELERSYINDIIKGRKKSVREDKLEQLAQSLDWSKAELISHLGAASSTDKSEISVKNITDSTYGVREEGARYDPSGSKDLHKDIVEKLLGSNPNASAWMIKSDVLALKGVRAGDIIIIDQSVEPRSGDVVCAQIEEGLRAKTVFRIYQPPNLVGAAFDPSAVRAEAVDGERVRIAGVMTELLRHRT